LTIILTFKVAGGVVLAADSRLTIRENGQVVHRSDTHTKLFALGPWAGLLTCGCGFLGGQAVARWVQDFVRNQPQALSEPLQGLAQQFLNSLPAADSDSTTFLFSGLGPEAAGGFAARMFKITVFANGQKSFFDLSESVSFWDGEFEAVTRLLLGRSPSYTQLIAKDSTGTALVQQADASTQAIMRVPYYALSLQEGVDFARFLVNLQIQYQHFSSEPQSCGGPVDVAVITPESGFQWINQKELS